MRPRKVPRLRVPLPRRNDVRLVDTLGRPGQGDAALVRRLYAEERCSIEEIACWLRRPRHEITGMLRRRTPRPRTPRDVHAFNAWLRTS